MRNIHSNIAVNGADVDDFAIPAGNHTFAKFACCAINTVDIDVHNRFPGCIILIFGGGIGCDTGIVDKDINFTKSFFNNFYSILNLSGFKMRFRASS